MDKNNGLSLKEFCDYVTEKIRSYLPNDYLGSRIQVYNDSTKSQDMRVVLGIQIIGSDFAPRIILDNYYTLYKSGKPLEDVMAQIARERVSKERQFNMALKSTTHIFDIQAGISKPWQHSKLYSYIGMCGHVIACTASYTLDAATLDSCPHTFIGGDLAVIYKIDFGEYRGKRCITEVTNDIFTAWGIEKAELHTLAMQNTQIEDPAVIMNMSGYLSELTGDPAYSDGACNDPTLVTSVHHNNISLFYPGELLKFEEKYPDGFYILPSSKEDFLIMPKDCGFTPKEISDFVKMTNKEAVKPDVRLSDYVHEYDSKIRRITAPTMHRTLAKQKNNTVENMSPAVAYAFGCATTETVQESKRLPMGNITTKNEKSQESKTDAVKTGRKKRTGR